MDPAVHCPRGLVCALLKSTARPQQSAPEKVHGEGIMVDCDTYTVQRGDTLSEIGEWFHVPSKELQYLNDIRDPDSIYPGQELRLARDQQVCTVYTVREGDTLSEIGELYRVQWQTLAHYNHLANPDVIRPGQKICIPQQAGAC
ncbi:LysM peptidoglycan-binding domain-containing protein [Saccharopolyspora gregorii]|uniref:LysM peptidoglycan-binding domain-containing protein n=1 Tax=Saccharopolyspora gregorii TaxID=33914 RepID=UPI0021ACE13B|nr:LysM peptidoglycan-binding domain-containing protein [Saccharopolyspora gregorii]